MRSHWLKMIMATSFWVSTAWSSDLDRHADIFDLSSGNYAKPCLERIHGFAHGMKGQSGALTDWFRKQFPNREILEINNHAENFFGKINPRELGQFIGNIHSYYEKMTYAYYAYSQKLSPPSSMFSDPLRNNLVNSIRRSGSGHKITSSKAAQIVSDFLNPIERIIEEIGEDPNLFIFMLTGLASLKCQTPEAKRSFNEGIRDVLEKDPVPLSETWDTLLKPSEDEKRLSPRYYPISSFPYDPEGGAVDDTGRCCESVILHFLRLTTGDHFSEKYSFLKKDPKNSEPHIEFLQYMKTINIPDLFFTPNNSKALDTGFMKTFHILGKMLDLEMNVQDVMGGDKWLENLCDFLGKQTNQSIVMSDVNLYDGTDYRKSKDIFGHFKITVNDGYSFDVSMTPLHGQIFQLSSEGKLKAMVQERQAKFTENLQKSSINRKLKTYLRAVSGEEFSPDFPSLFNLANDPTLKHLKDPADVTFYGSNTIPELFSSVQCYALHKILSDRSIEENYEEYIRKTFQIISAQPKVKTNYKDHFEKLWLDPSQSYSVQFFDLIKLLDLNTIKNLSIRNGVDPKFMERFISLDQLSIDTANVECSNESEHTHSFLENAKIHRAGLYPNNKYYFRDCLKNPNTKTLWLCGDWGTEWSYLDNISIGENPDKIILFQNQQSLDSFRSSFDRKFGWIAQNVF